MRPRDLTYLKRWVGKLVIYEPMQKVDQGKKSFSGPSVVYITGVNRRGHLLGQKLNSSELFVGHPRWCAEYSPRLFNRALFLHHRKDALARLACANKRLKTGKY